MTLEEIFEGGEEMNHVDVKGKNSPGEESASVKALRSMLGMLSEKQGSQWPRQSEPRDIVGVKVIKITGS